MFDKLKSLFSGAPAEEAAPSNEDIRIAVAALLVEAARADEHYEEKEKALIDAALSAKFDLDAQGAASLRARGETEQDGALDLHRYTKLVKTMSEEERVAVIECLWRIILSDGQRDPFEDALVRRVCGLIYVDDPESGAARRRVENELQARTR